MTAMLRVTKIWEGDGAFLVLAVQRFGRNTATQKFFLIVDANQRSQGVRAATEKPEGLKAQGAFVALVRKHAPTGGLSGIFRQKSDGTLWLPLHTKGGDAPGFFLQVLAAKPPELRFIAQDPPVPAAVLVRKSSQGTFTKRRDLGQPTPESFATEEFEDLTDETLAALVTPEREAGESPDEEKKDDAAPGDGLPEFQRDAGRRLARKLKTVRKYRDKSAASTPHAAAIEGAERSANLLKASTHLLREGLHEINISTDLGPLRVELDPELSPGANIDLAFVNLKKLKRAAAVGHAEEKKASHEVHALETALAKMRDAPLSERDVAAVLRDFRVAAIVRPNAPRDARAAAATPYKTYFLALPKSRTDDVTKKAKALVGKGAHENDELCRSAKSDDWWFHAVGLHGSHVVLPSRQLPNGLTPELIRGGAILALHHSKAKDNLRGEVYVTQRRHLRKKKGLPPGLWLVEQAETVFVAYTESELAEILSEKEGPR